MLKIEDLTHIFQCLNSKFELSNNCDSRIRINFYNYKPNGLAVKKKKIFHGFLFT